MFDECFGRLHLIRYSSYVTANLIAKAIKDMCSTTRNDRMTSPGHKENYTIPLICHEPLCFTVFDECFGRLRLIRYASQWLRVIRYGGLRLIREATFIRYSRLFKVPH